MPTRNRGALLRNVLSSYEALQSPPGGWLLVVVDNGSTDETRAILAAAGTRLPLQVLTEPLPGKNRAVNRAIEAVESDLVAFTDDDTFPRADWLIQIDRAAVKHPDDDVFGGTVVPRWETPPPAWITAWVPKGPTFTATTPGLPDGPTVPSEVFGPNFIVRRRVLAAGLRFDLDIGPSGRSYAMGSETAFLWRAVRRGFRIRHVPDMVVEHHVASKNCTREFVLRRAYQLGRGQFRIHRGPRLATMPSLLGVPRYLLRRAVTASGKALRARVRRDAKAVFDADWQLRLVLGNLAEAWRVGRLASRDLESQTSLGVAEASSGPPPSGSELLPTAGSPPAPAFDAAEAARRGPH